MVNCCRNIKRFIKRCDFFGTFVTFRINDEIEYKSIVGGITSIIFFIVAILYIIYVAIPFATRKNIEFIFSYKILESKPFLNLTKVRFNFGFGIQYKDDGIPAVSDFKKYFNYSISLKERMGDNKVIEYPFGIKYCSHSDFFNVVNHSFDTNGVGEMLCPIVNKSVNYTLDGLFTDSYYKYFELTYKLTDYAMEHLDELETLIEKKRLEMIIYFIDTGINYKNRTKPLPSFVNYLTRCLDLFIVKQSEISISSIEFSNDENLLFKKEKTSIDAAFDKAQDKFYSINRETVKDNLVGKFIIKASSKILSLDRSYQKFPSFVADLTGILEDILLLILVLITIMERQAIDNKLIHKMLKIKGSKSYDVNYFLNVFKRDKLSNEVTNLIKRGSFQIERTSSGKILSKRKSIMRVLDKNKSISNQISVNMNQKVNNFFQNPNPIQINQQSKDNNYNIDIIPNEENLIHLIKITKDKTARKKISFKNVRRSNSFSISSIPSEDENVKTTERKLSVDCSLNISNSESEPNINDKKCDNQLNQRISLNNDSSIINIYKKKNPIKQAEEDFATIGVISAVFTNICFWTSKYQKRKYELLKKAEKKVHYYLEVFNYIQGMQEIDLLKYCLFNKEQIILFNYLSSPPFKTDDKEINDIYKEFESDQVIVGKITKKNIDDVYRCYNEIRNKEEITFEDLKLLRLINAEAEFLS
jgi:hypothetical protein